jgi:hypothetical protein
MPSSTGPSIAKMVAMPWLCEAGYGSIWNSGAATSWLSVPTVVTNPAPVCITPHRDC